MLLSASEKIFYQFANHYRERLRNSRYSENLKYEPETEEKHIRKWKRSIIWFIPPYSTSAKTNINKYFLRLLQKCFPPNHKFRNFFYKNTVKIRYCCMPNLKTKINRHDKKYLTKHHPWMRESVTVSEKKNTPWMINACQTILFIPLHSLQATKITNLDHTKESTKPHSDYDTQTTKSHLTSKIT